MISQYNNGSNRNKKNRGKGRRNTSFWGSLPTPTKVLIFVAGGMAVFLTVVILIQAIMGSSADDTFSDSAYSEMYNSGLNYASKSGNNVGDMAYTAPLMVNYLGTYNKDINSYTEKQWIDAINTYYKMYNPLMDSFPVYDIETESVISPNGETMQETDSTLESSNFVDDSVVAESITLNSQYSGVSIDETEQAMLFHLVLLLPQYEKGSVSIPQSFLEDINNIFMIHSSSEEEYDMLVSTVEKTGYINVLNDSEAGYDILSLDYGSVSINESSLADAKKGKAYPVTDLESTGNLHVCYQVEESGNYLFTQAEYGSGDEKEVANSSTYGVYDDYEDCIKGKYELSSVPRLGYSRTAGTNNISDEGSTTAADGKINSSESFEVTEVAAGQYIEANGVEVQKLSDNQDMEDIEED